MFCCVFVVNILKCLYLMIFVLFIFLLFFSWIGKVCSCLFKVLLVDILSCKCGFLLFSFFKVGINFRVVRDDVVVMCIWLCVWFNCLIVVKISLKLLVVFWFRYLFDGVKVIFFILWWNKLVFKWFFRLVMWCDIVVGVIVSLVVVVLKLFNCVVDLKVFKVCNDICIVEFV